MGKKTVGNVRWSVLFYYFPAESEWEGQAGLPDSHSHEGTDLQIIVDNQGM